MFGKLKNKLKEWTNKVADIKDDNQPSDLETPEEKEIEEKSNITTKEEKKGFLKKIFSKKTPKNYFIYKFSGRTEEEVEETLNSLENEYGKGFIYNRDLKEEGESREQIIKKFKEKIEEFSKTNPGMKFIIDYQYGIGRMMKLEIDEGKKYNFEIIEINKPKEEPSAVSHQPLAKKEITKEKEKNPSEVTNSIIPKDSNRDPDGRTGAKEKDSPSEKGIDKEAKKEQKERKPTSDTSEQTKEPYNSKKFDRDSNGRAGTEKKSIFKKLTSSKKTITENQFDDYAEDLEMILLENNVALEVVDKILEEIKEQIVNHELSKKEILNKITTSLTEKIKEVLQEPFDIEKEIENKEGPYIILFCGINGTGKTTTISKIANMFKKKGKSVVMAAADTFRAAAIEQLKAHGEKLNIKVITQDYGSDPAAVGFDAIKYAIKNKIDLVLIDTAGRIHTATNLIREMKKIKKVCKPDRTLFVGEAITGNDAVDQVRAFNNNIGIDGIVLSKSDIDEKGGTALSVGYITKKPIIFLGTGQNYEDIEPFDKKKFLEKLDLE